MLLCSQFMPIMLQKYAIMLLSKIIFFTEVTDRNDRPHLSETHVLRLSTSLALTLEGIFPRVFNVFSIARDCVPEAIRQATSTTTGLNAFGHFFLSSHMKTAHAQYTRG